MLAGLIDTRRHHGPDMPLDAKVLARLPLKVLRRVLPELPPERIAIDELSRRYPPCLGHEWTLHEWITNTVGEFGLVEQQDDPVDCDVCSGEGEFFMGSCWYDCQECDGEGRFVSPNEAHPLVVLYAHQDGTILTRHPITGADADVDMARRFRL